MFHDRLRFGLGVGLVAASAAAFAVAFRESLGVVYRTVYQASDDVLRARSV